MLQRKSLSRVRKLQDNANSLVNRFVALWSFLCGLWSVFVVIWPLHVVKLLEIYHLFVVLLNFTGNKIKLLFIGG